MSGRGDRRWPAGWYTHADGTRGYWDGERWAATEAGSVQRREATPGPAGNRRRGVAPWVWLAAVVGAFALLVGGVGFVGPLLNSESPSDSAASAASEGADASPIAPTPEAVPSSTEAPSLPLPPALPPAPTLPAAPAAVQVIRVVDGDTIETSVGKIRLIGIDTPERGECNYASATSELEAALAAHGNQVVLVPGARDDQDRYGRLLRYVETPGGEDINLHMVTTGYAIARYDSRDGYGGHTREADYIAADASSADPGCAVTSGGGAVAEPAPAPPAVPVVGEPWNQPGPDLDCSDIGRRVTITGPDYHNLDSDGDGVACESLG